jgi:hypothetical protein
MMSAVIDMGLAMGITTLVTMGIMLGVMVLMKTRYEE